MAKKKKLLGLDAIKAKIVPTKTEEKAHVSAFSYSEEENPNTKNCPCGESFSWQEPTINLDAWEALHAPHLRGQPNIHEKEEMAALADADPMPASRWPLITMMSATPYRQGDLFDESIVVRCKLSKRVRNNYEVHVIPFGETESNKEWLIQFWNYFRKN